MDVVERRRLISEFEKLLVDDQATALRVRDGKFELLDQRKLPNSEEWLPCDTIQQMITYIKQLSTRGAPMIGCAAALALVVHTIDSYPNDPNIVQNAENLKSSRPTAVNLMYACDLIAQQNEPKQDYTPQNISKIAKFIISREIDMCLHMATNGAGLIQKGENILTHCNTGSLATVGLGTALGVIKMAHQQGKGIHVFVDETRPLLQGGRLTAYELQKQGIPYTIICDNMAATLMQQGSINRVLVGADRIALNGDFANKIGTYSVAVLAKYHNVPFHVVAPVSTIDFNCESGAKIPIEKRSPKEVHGAFGVSWAPEGSPAYNPAFDVTPVELVTSVILDVGVYTMEDIVQNNAIRKLKEKNKT